MKTHFIPKTKFGKLSFWLFIAFIVLFILTQIIAAIGRFYGAFDGAGINIYKTLIPVTIIPAVLSGIAAFVTGLISIIKSKERALFVYLSSFTGLLITWFVLGELLLPH